MDLLHFLEVYVGNMVVRTVAGCSCTGVGLACTRVLCLLLGIENVLLGSAEGCLDILDGSVNACDILSPVCLFKACHGSFDSALLVGGNLVAEFAQLLFGLEDDGIGLVELVDASMRMLCSLPVALSLADTLRMPLASISNVTSI